MTHMVERMRETPGPKSPAPDPEVDEDLGGAVLHEIEIPGYDPERRAQRLAAAEKHKNESLVIDTFERRPKPTQKQRRFVARLAYHGSDKLAAVEAGFSPATDPRNIKRAIAKTSISDELEKVGVTNKRIADHMAQGLEANRNFRYGKEDFIEEPDWHARFKYANRILALKGEGTKTVHEHNLNLNMQGILVGAFKLMARSSGVEVDEERLAQEVCELGGAHEPFAGLEAAEADFKPSSEEEEEE